MTQPYFLIGQEDAPVTFEIFYNMSCPGSAIFYKDAKKLLPPLVQEGKAKVILYFYDKPREELLLGTLVHLSLQYDQPEKSLRIIDDLFETQEEWLHLTQHELKDLLVSKYDLEQEEIEENTEISLAVTAEAIKRGVKSVPTLFINGEKCTFKERRIYSELPKYVEEAIHTHI